MEDVKKERQFCLQRVRALEPDFLVLRAGLNAAQQELLDDYIAACEALTAAETILYCLLPQDETPQ